MARYAVASVAKLEILEDGTVLKTVLSAPRKRRVSKRYRKVDKVVRRLSRANQVASSEFLSRYERSNGKKKNGGLRGVTRNLQKSTRKGFKKLRLL
jgi:hypothetical protein